MFDAFHHLVLEVHGVLVDDALPDVVEAILGVYPVQGLGLVTAEEQRHLGRGQAHHHHGHKQCQLHQEAFHGSLGSW